MTTQGLALLKAEVAGTDSITFTKIAFSSDDYSQSADSTVQDLTGLSNLDLTATARSFTDVNGNLKIRAVANNQNTTSAFYIKTYGLYGKNNAGNELLIAVATTQNANFVPAYNGKQTNQVAYTFNIAISSTNNITISSPTDVPVTQADVANLNSTFSSLQSEVSSNLINITNNSDAIDNLQSNVSANGTAISQISSIANDAKATAYDGLRFMGDMTSNFLYTVQTSGIYNLAGRIYTDWTNTQLFGVYVVINAGGGVVKQIIFNNTNNCWVQVCNSWGNTGFKQVY